MGVDMHMYMECLGEDGKWNALLAMVPSLVSPGAFVLKNLVDYRNYELFQIMGDHFDAGLPNNVSDEVKSIHDTYLGCCYGEKSVRLTKLKKYFKAHKTVHIDYDCDWDIEEAHELDSPLKALLKDIKAYIRIIDSFGLLEDENIRLVYWFDR